MTNEKKKLLMQTAAVIRAIVEKHKYSKATWDIGPGDAWYEDCCKFMALVCDLQEFAAHMENMVKYSEMSEKVWNETI